MDFVVALIEVLMNVVNLLLVLVAVMGMAVVGAVSIVRD